jgi:hypothetical protein
MRAWIRKWWRVLKVAFAIAILLAIGRQFARDLSSPDLWERPPRFDWLAFSSLLYLLGLAWSCLYWYLLLGSLGQRPRLSAAMRAHFMGQLGKYLPGKAWALLLRSNVVRASGVGVGVAVMTSFYEVLTSMATGALLATCAFAVQIKDFSTPPEWQDLLRLDPRQPALAAPVDPKIFALMGLAMAFVIGIPVLPPVFNRLVRRITMPLRNSAAGPIPQIRWTSFFQGLILTVGCWLLFGGSLWAALQGIMSSPPAWSVETWWQYTSFMALAYVAGFIILWLPSGLGAREQVLVLCLVPEISRLQSLEPVDARKLAVYTVLALRLAWTVGELVTVGLLYWLPSRAPVNRE